MFQDSKCSGNTNDFKATCIPTNWHVIKGLGSVVLPCPPFRSPTQEVFTHLLLECASLGVLPSPPSSKPPTNSPQTQGLDEVHFHLEASPAFCRPCCSLSILKAVHMNPSYVQIPETQPFTGDRAPWCASFLIDRLTVTCPPRDHHVHYTDEEIKKPENGRICSTLLCSPGQNWTVNPAPDHRLELPSESSLAGQALTLLCQGAACLQWV